NVLEHQLVPEHRLVPEEEAERVLKALNITRDQLPKIRKSDPVIQVLEKIEGPIEEGRIIRVTRVSGTAGVSEAYRLVIGRQSMRELIDAFFRERSIVNHHIASFNDFLPTIDNPNSRMQRIVENRRSSPEDERRGIIKLDEDRTEGDGIEIRIGRKRDERGLSDLEAKPPITLGLPVGKEANGATH